MKICELCAVDFTLYHFLLALMQGMVRAGHEVAGVSADGPLLDEVRGAGFRVEVVPFSRSYNLASHLRAYRALVELFRRERFDMVHVHTPVAALIGRIAARRAGVPRIVYTAHGFYFHDRMAWPMRAAFIALEWLAGRVTDVLFTQAREDAETARRLGLCRGGVVEAIGNGVDPGRFYPPGPDDARRSELRAALGAPAGAVVVMMIGRLVAEKGYLELFEAMGRVDAVLWVVGERLESDRRSAVEAAVAGLEEHPELAQRIRFLGYRRDVPELLRAADIFTLPSHREGMPRSIIEAMMTGLPVVATDIRGSREEVVPGETGLLVPVGDSEVLAEALGRLVGDAALRRRLGRAGRVRALELYDEAKVVARQLDLLGLAPARPVAASAP
ncbi:MAG: glycosyltransferase family 4 protein [Proteobacteria bacterium]|nr:glycosyltransferase family 4 protein [Pseudomonadota bacterium]